MIYSFLFSRGTLWWHFEVRISDANLQARLLVLHFILQWHRVYPCAPEMLFEAAAHTRSEISFTALPAESITMAGSEKFVLRGFF